MTSSKPTIPDNPWLKAVTEGYGSRGLRLYHIFFAVGAAKNHFDLSLLILRGGAGSGLGACTVYVIYSAVGRLATVTGTLDSNIL